jgi:iron complex outermembrane receptor protein
MPAAYAPALSTLAVLIAAALAASRSHAGSRCRPCHHCSHRQCGCLHAGCGGGDRFTHQHAHGEEQFHADRCDLRRRPRCYRQGNLLEALQRSLPSLSQIGGYQSDQESLIRGYQLRNLSPGYTLVLVNGKRRNASAYVSGANGGGFPGHAGRTSR